MGSTSQQKWSTPHPHGSSENVSLRYSKGEVVLKKVDALLSVCTEAIAFLFCKCKFMMIALVQRRNPLEGDWGSLKSVHTTTFLSSSIYVLRWLTWGSFPLLDWGNYSYVSWRPHTSRASSLFLTWWNAPTTSRRLPFFLLLVSPSNRSHSHWLGGYLILL